MKAVFAALSQFGPMRLMLVFGVTAGVALALFTLVFRAGASDGSLLYSGLELSEAGEIVSELNALGITTNLKGDGSTIFVPAKDVARARAALADKGLPTNGNVGWEIFDKQDTFGTTSFVQNVNSVRALQGELARTIQAIDGIRSARVHLVLPERRLFDRSSQTATASIMIGLSRPELAARQAASIRHLVAAAVPGLTPERVTILDETGRLLVGASQGDENAFDLGSVADRKAAEEARLRQRIVEIVESVVGPGNARVQVTADMDFNRITESAEIFDPESQVARSVQLVEDSSSENNTEGDGAVTVAENVPGGADTGANRNQSSVSSSRLEETTNFEISRTTRTQVREVGAIERLSIAVNVDGIWTTDEEGNSTYAPRADEDMQRISALIRSAVGFDAERGDTIEVTNIQFARTDLSLFATEAPGGFALDKNDIMRFSELGVLLVVSILILFFVARPMISGIMGGASAAMGGPLTAAALPGGSAKALPGGASVSAAQLPGAEKMGALPAPDDDDDTIDIARVQGQVKASSVKKVADVVSSHPDESVAILRTWLQEG